MDPHKQSIQSNVHGLLVDEALSLKMSDIVFHPDHAVVRITFHLETNFSDMMEPWKYLVHLSSDQFALHSLLCYLLVRQLASYGHDPCNQLQPIALSPEDLGIARDLQLCGQDCVW